MSDLTATKTLPQAIPPVTVTVIGDAVPSGAPIPSGSVLTTPDHQPNVIYTVISPIVAILVRFGNTFCVSLAGALAAGGLSTSVIPHAHFIEVLKPSIILAAYIAGVGLLKDAATVFSGMEKRFPLASGSV